MTHLSQLNLRRAALLLPVLLVALVVGTVFDGEAASRTESPQRVLVVVDASSGHDAALESRAASALRRAERTGAVDGQLRVPRTPTEQLSVTRYFAAQGYDRVVAVGLDRRVAIDPVAARYPDVRFQIVGERALGAALSATAG